MKPTYEELEKKCALQQSKLALLNELMGVVEKAGDVAKAGIEGLQSQNEELASRLANAESKCRELAGENAELKNFIINDCHVAHIEPETFYEEEITRYVSADGYEPETPATDTFLAEARAQGVEMFAFQQSQIAAEQEQAGDYEFSRHCSISAAEACEFAEELCEGKCCEVES